ncbi:hypothetical protein C9J21_04320 [Photobacterium phosphoreum]|uniref:helix-turn-helix domain-containing protein n=1 Tax=Photobacterium phosphoreum TaxID=659 RepID=UPI000D16CDD9|nr:helix-turn-helix domain-containing protein [Photobacterium phosphoreum]PSW34577.1 hypothetical protein C9J21_04320 [Photobacterium phosphoreum]
MADLERFMEFQGIRLLLGLNQSQFAEHLGISRTTVYRLEKNLMEIDNRTLYAARYLQCTVSAERRGERLPDGWSLGITGGQAIQYIDTKMPVRIKSNVPASNNVSNRNNDSDCNNDSNRNIKPATNEPKPSSKNQAKRARKKRR